jgi:hypothetical protein
MSSPIKIVGPFALAEDTAAALGVSKARAKQIRAIVTPRHSSTSSRLTARTHAPKKRAARKK